jgi:hypothetical protein
MKFKLSLKTFLIFFPRFVQPLLTGEKSTTHVNQLKGKFMYNAQGISIIYKKKGLHLKLQSTKCVKNFVRQCIISTIEIVWVKCNWRRNETARKKTTMKKIRIYLPYSGTSVKLVLTRTHIHISEVQNNCIQYDRILCCALSLMFRRTSRTAD